MLKMFVRLQNWLRREDGQALSEYGTLIALVLVASISLIIIFRNELGQVLTDITNGLKNR